MRKGREKMDDNFNYDMFNPESNSSGDEKKYKKIIFDIIAAIIIVAGVLWICDMMNILVECEMCGKKVFRFATESFFGMPICSKCNEDYLNPLFDYFS